MTSDGASAVGGSTPYNHPMATDEWDRVRTEPRAPGVDVSLRGIGTRRAQLLVCPSFGRGHAWELRERDGFVAYRSDVVHGKHGRALVGYDRLDVASSVLADWFARVVALSLPLSPRLDRLRGLDGTHHELAVFGDLSSAWRFAWWDDPPDGWQPLVILGRELAQMLAPAAVIAAGP